jgi:uncharacterized protein (TIGR03435 family)
MEISANYRATGVLAALAVVISAHLFGQVAPQRPSFEVVSLKVNTTNGVSDQVPRRSGDRIVMRNARLGMIVSYAYNLETPVYQLAGVLDLPGPEEASWFDIEAIAPGAPGDDDLRLMFQSLLEDRFKLKVHREAREMTLYDLVIAKGGSRMKESDPDRKIIIGNGLSLRMGSSFFAAAVDGSHLGGKGASIARLAAALSQYLRAPVQDRTGLTGTFDYDVVFSVNDVSSNVTSAPLLATAIQEELGLKLESTKGPVEVMVVDHVEKPTAN